LRNAQATEMKCHYGSCHLSICPAHPLIWKKMPKIKVCANMPQGGSDLCANFQLNRSKFKVRIWVAQCSVQLDSRWPHSIDTVLTPSLIFVQNEHHFRLMPESSSHCHLSSQLSVPWTRTKYNNHSFTNQSPRVWNSLPADLQVLLKQSENEYKTTYNGTTNAFCCIV